MPPPKQRPPPIFRRFPTWMWRNTDVQAFVHWLRDWNASLEPAKRAGFYGLDLYNMSASIASVLAYLDDVLLNMQLGWDFIQKSSCECEVI